MTAGQGVWEETLSSACVAMSYWVSPKAFDSLDYKGRKTDT